MRKTILILSLLVVRCAMTAQRTVKVNYKKVNKAALHEYSRPLRPGGGGRPFWNGYAKKFLYAPAFDFKARAGAAGYLFVATDGKTSWSFRANTPQAPLSPIWNALPTGEIRLIVIALDERGQQTTDTVGKRTFVRDFPFQGPYNTPVRPYLEAARRSLLFIHNMKAMRQWRETGMPDMGYRFNAYPAKIVSAAIQIEVLVARYFPALREEALRSARGAAKFLMEQSQPPGSPLAYFPPTYYGDRMAAGLAENKGKTMGMEPTKMGEAMLDLYEETRDEAYMTWALGIARTYQSLQRQDGSIPIKLDLTTGKAVNEAGAMLNELLQFLLRLKQHHGVVEFEPMRQKGEQWMQKVALQTFDLTGQFEDVTVNVAPYSNLTNCTASTYASYLFQKTDMTTAELQDAKDLMALSEDQFTYWDSAPTALGLPTLNTPCVFEQYHFEMPIDNSACNVASGFLDMYKKTGDRLALAKSLALANQLTIMQDAVTGCIPTAWKPDPNYDHSYMWLNCQLTSIQMLLKMAEQNP